MTAKVTLPTEAQVEAARLHQAADASSTGRRPSVSALARALGLSNATFWRHFPDIARDVAAQRRATPNVGVSATQSDDAVQDLRHQNARLRRDNRTLGEQLEFAIANIQRLSLENRQMHLELDRAGNVTRLFGETESNPSAPH